MLMIYVGIVFTISNNRTFHRLVCIDVLAYDFAEFTYHFISLEWTGSHAIRQILTMETLTIFL